MPDEGKILTALGLDTSEFESGVSRATGRVNVLVGALNSVDGELRKIPIVGDIYSASFGKIVDGFAEITEQNREFSRIMNTDVSGSLNGTLSQIEDINVAIKKLDTKSFSKFIAEAFSPLENPTAGGVLKRMFLGPLSGQKTVADTTNDSQRLELAKKRETLTGDILKLTRLNAEASHVELSGSSMISEELKQQLEYEEKKQEIQKISYMRFGPDQEEKRTAFVKEQMELAGKNLDQEKSATEKRDALRIASLEGAERMAKLQSSGATPEALAYEKLRMSFVDRILASTREETQEAETKIAISAQEYVTANRITELQRNSIQLSRDEANIRREGYNETLYAAQARLDAAQKERELAVGEIEQARAEIGIMSAETEVKIATEARLEWEHSLEITKSIAESRNSQLITESKSLALQEKRVSEEIAAMNKAGGMQDAIKQKEVVLAQIQKQRWENALSMAEKYNSAALEADLAEAQTAGQTRAINQLEIRLRYENQIADAIARQDTKLAESLTRQRDAAQLAEQIRQYDLGARGRAQERAEERKHAQKVRIVQAQQRTRDRDEKYKEGLSSGGLVSSGLKSGGLIKVKKEKQPDHKPFQEDLMLTLKDISKSLSR